MEGGNEVTVCRLRNTGNFEKWDFAIYKFRREKYDENEWMYQGSRHVNGTILGALKAENEAYPPSWSPLADKDFMSIIGNLFSNNKK
jgi:hypothetical protein